MTMRHIPRKRFGQHFLIDQGLIEQLIACIAPQEEDRMVEIGPGLGAMTFALVRHLSQLTVIELDRDLARRWRTQPKVHVIESDVLKVDFAALLDPQAKQKLRVVGNLPYNISTPILFHLFDVADFVSDQHFMLQKEVVDRMVAQPGTADYGRLSVMLQWRYAMQAVLDVPPQSFDPPPRVMSAVVRMRPKNELPLINQTKLAELVRVAFSQRRKLLHHTMRPWLESQKFSGVFDLQRRAQEVSVQEYVALAQNVSML